MFVNIVEVKIGRVAFFEPEISITPDNPVICQGESISLLANGIANSYDWTDEFGNLYNGIMCLFRC